MSDFYINTLWYLVFVVSVCFHEACHAWVAKKNGDNSAAMLVSLDPIPHILREPFGMVILPLFSLYLYGWPMGFAHVPVHPEWMKKFPKKAALMAMAGPVMNLAIALVVALFIKFGLSFGWFSTETLKPGMLLGGSGDYGTATVAMILSVFFTMNLVLGIFNLLPLPPLDGSGMIPLFLTKKMSRKYLDLVHQPMAGFIGLFLAWNIFPGVFGGVFAACKAFLYL